MKRNFKGNIKEINKNKKVETNKNKNRIGMLRNCQFYKSINT